MKIIIDIVDCSGCPHSKIESVIMEDSLKIAYKWTCKKENRVISEVVEIFDETPIPEWCPIKIKL